MKWSWQPDLKMNDIKIMTIKSMLIFTGGNKVLSARLLDVSISVIRDAIALDSRLSEYRSSLEGRRPTNRGRARYQWQEHVAVMRAEREKRALEVKEELESRRIEEKWELQSSVIDESKEVSSDERRDDDTD